MSPVLIFTGLFGLGTVVLGLRAGRILLDVLVVALLARSPNKKSFSYGF